MKRHGSTGHSRAACSTVNPLRLSLSFSLPLSFSLWPSLAGGTQGQPGEGRCHWALVHSVWKASGDGCKSPLTSEVRPLSPPSGFSVLALVGSCFSRPRDWLGDAGDKASCWGKLAFWQPGTCLPSEGWDGDEQRAGVVRSGIETNFSVRRGTLPPSRR